MEYLDVLDAEGNPTGEKKLRTKIHRDGDWHRSVRAWIMNDRQEVLLQKRSPLLPSGPNQWDSSIAGHVSSEETSLATVVKEAREELGLALSDKDFEYLFTAAEQDVWQNGVYINNEFNDVYLVRRDLSLSSLQLLEEKVTAVTWMHFLELEKHIRERDKNFYPHSVQYKKLFAVLHERYGE